MGEDPASEQVKYLHGSFGKGAYAFLGGHDPEDYRHFVGDPPTDLSLHRNSPGYRHDFPADVNNLRASFGFPEKSVGAFQPI